MVNLRIYVEGGGDSADLHKECREAFGTLIKKLGLPRAPKIIAAGSRNDAFEDFCERIRQAPPNEVVLLLVDSEDPIRPGTTPWQHVAQRDSWEQPPGSVDGHLHFMATCMETWLCADRGALIAAFGRDKLQESALPAIHALEQRPRGEVQSALEAATRQCERRRQYHKGRRSFQVLALVSPQALRDAKLSWFERFEKDLRSHLGT